MFVADASAGTISYIPPNCGSPIVITNWASDQIVGRPQSLAIFNGGLFVADSASNRILYLLLDRLQVAGVVDTAITGRSVKKIEIDSDGLMYLIVDGRQLFTVDLSTSFDLSTLALRLFLDSPLVVDIHDISSSPLCGLFFSAGDNNQVWRCPGRGAACTVLCADGGTDSSSCAFLQDPFGLAVGELFLSLLSLLSIVDIVLVKIVVAIFLREMLATATW